MAWTRYFRRRYWDDERARELRGYVEIETDDNIARGMSPDEARSAAQRKLGNAVLVREEIYRMNTLGLLESLLQDLRYGARALRLNLGFASIAIASLTIGIGANTTIFQLLDAIRLRSLPVKNPQDWLPSVWQTESGVPGVSADLIRSSPIRCGSSFAIINRLSQASRLGVIWGSTWLAAGKRVSPMVFG